MRKWIPCAEKHLLVESELVLGAPGQVLGEVGGVEQKCPSPFTHIKAGVRAGVAKRANAGRRERRGRCGGGGQVLRACVVPSGWVCCGVDRGRLRAFWKKS